MNSWGLNCVEVDMTMANPQRRGLDLDIDLNYPSPPQMRALDLSLGLSSYNSYSSQQVQVQPQVHEWSQSHHYQVTNAAIEILDDEDEVAIISPRTFSQARENSERNHSHGKRAMLREDTGNLRGHLAAATLCTNCKTRIPDDCQPYLKPGTSNKKDRNVSMILDSAQPAPSPEESIFSCPVCISPLVEPTSTRCGHIFCKECLQRSLKSSHNKCPTCRQKVGKRGIFRVYLPTTN